MPFSDFILDKLSSKEKQERVQEKKRAKLLQRVFKEYLHCFVECKPAKHYEEEYLHDIFKKRYNFLHEDGENQELGEDNYSKNL